MPQLGHTWSTSLSPSTHSGMRQHLQYMGGDREREREGTKRERGMAMEDGYTNRHGGYTYIAARL